MKWYNVQKAIMEGFAEFADFHKCEDNLVEAIRSLDEEK